MKAGVLASLCVGRVPLPSVIEAAAQMDPLHRALGAFSPNSLCMPQRLGNAGCPIFATLGLP